MYKRTIQTTIHMASENFPILLITGPRQVGKTTVLKICAEEDRKYVTLDDLRVRQLAKEDPALFVQSYPAPLIIGEIQYAPELFSYLKIEVDKQKKKGMYWLTGSQKFHLMREVSESLAGRVAVLDMLGLSNAEFNKQAFLSQPFLPSTYVAEKQQLPASALETYKTIWQGSFPAMVESQPQTRDLFFTSYIQTYIQRDIQSLLQTVDHITFFNFITAVAARTSQELNYMDISKDIGIDSKTCKSWISILEASGIIFLLQPYFTNINKRLIKRPKLYFLDTGLCAYLTRWSDHHALAAGNMSGAILETYAFSEILKSYWHNGKTPNIYYYRDQSQREIDLVIEENNTLYPVEFKKTAMPSKSHAKHFSALAQFNKPIGEGAILCLIQTPLPLSPTLHAIPIHYL